MNKKMRNRTIEVAQRMRESGYPSVEAWDVQPVENQYGVKVFVAVIGNAMLVYSPTYGENIINVRLS